MKFDSNIMSILSNFTELNKSLIIEPGNKLRTISSSREVYVETLVPLTFDKKICIYDLDQFIKILKLFKEPELTFEDNHAIIQENSRSFTFMYAAENTLDRYNLPSKVIDFENICVDFDLPKDSLEDIMKVVKVISLPNVTVSGDGNDINITVEKADERNSNNYSINLGKTDKIFRAVFNASTLKIIKDDYNVKISSDGISKFVSNNMMYLISVDYRSKF